MQGSGRKDPTRGVGWLAGWSPPIGTEKPSGQVAVPATKATAEPKKTEVHSPGKPGWHNANLED